MSGYKTAKLLISLARDDLKNVRLTCDNPEFSDATFGFHAQQAVEKAMKAWLCTRDIEYPRKHDLEMLAELATKNGMELPTFLPPLLFLTQFAVRFRYESWSDIGVVLNRNEIMAHVEELVSWIEKCVEAV